MKIASALGLALLVISSAGIADRARSQTAAKSAPPAKSAQARVSLEATADVAAALSARSPHNVADLRLIQSQLQRVIKQAQPATVAVQIGRAAGSGVIVNKEGLVLTAAHVIGRPGRRAWVELPDGRRLRGRTLGGDHDLDAGMVQLDAPPADLPFAPVYEGESLKDGEWVVTIGQPGGIVSDRAPPIRFGRVLFRDDEMLCTDCKLVGGDSGGPLFNMRGEVVGIHSSIGPMITHNFHVPIKAFRQNWERLVAGEMWGDGFDEELEAGRPVLGVSGREQEGRCVITQVFPGSPADKAGVRQGDVVVRVNAREVDTFDQLARIVFFQSPGDKVRLTIERDGERLEVTAVLAGLQ